MTRSFRRWLTLALLPLARCAPPPPQDVPVPAPAAVADTVRRDRVADGVDYYEVRVPSGPWAIHVLEIDRERCRPVLRAAKAGPPPTERSLTSALGARALAAINADFFALPAGTTVGADVSSGNTRMGPGLRPAFSVLPTGYHAGPLAVRGYLAAPGDTLPVTQVNRPLAGDAQHPPAGGATLLTAWLGDTAPVDSAGRLIILRLRPGATPASGLGVVAAVRDTRAPRAFADLAFITRDTAWAARRAVNDTVQWRVQVVTDSGVPVIEAVGGFPVLLHHGRNVLDEASGLSAAFGEARHPRTAVGWNDRRLFLVVVDGRQAPYSDGVSLPELRDLFQRLGAHTAINLDGGGSSAMVVDGVVVNRPSDREGERPVGNALLLERCAS